MSSALAKAAALPLALAATWTTAHADDFRVSVTPTENLSGLRLFTERNDLVTNFPIGTPTASVQGQALTDNLGPLASGSTYSTVVSTSYGTSALNDFPFDFSSTALELGFLATTSGGDLALSSAQTSGSTYAVMFGTPTGVSQADALTGASTGDLATASALYPATSANALYGAIDTATQTATLYAFGSNGTARSIGTVSVQAVPEPASMAALGVGALALLRRKRK